jgi:tetratricopeptide (TPR) repeat protein
MTSPSLLVLTNQSTLLDAMQTVSAELSLDGPCEFTDDLDHALTLVEGTELAVVLLDGALGITKVSNFFAQLKTRPNREFCLVVLMIPESTPQLIAAGAEWNVTKMLLGNLSPAKLKFATEDLMAMAVQSDPLRPIMKNVQELRRQKKFGDLVEILEDLYAAAPENKRVALELGEAYLDQNESQKCFDFLSPFVEAESPEPRALHVSAKALVKLGRHHDAADLLTKADVMNPIHFERLIDLGNALLSLDRPVEAEEAFERAKKIDPSSDQPDKGIATAKMLEGDINEALRILKDKVAWRELGSIFNTAAVIAMRFEKFEKGALLYESARKALAPDPILQAKVCYNLGIGYLRWSKPVAAKAEFSKALQQDPSLKNAQFNIAAIDAGNVKIKAKQAQPIAHEVHREIQFEQDAVTGQAMKKTE